MISIRELADTEIEGKKNLVFPLKLEQAGWVSDARGEHVLDIRGWSRISPHRNADIIYEKVGTWVVETLNAAYEAQNDL
jgi:hypothetical protein